jgi:PA domain
MHHAPLRKEPPVNKPYVNKLISHLTKAGAALALVGSLTVAIQATAATFKVINTDEPGVGFNDKTPAAPVGLNPGKTVGEQRLIALNFLGGIWAKAIGGNDVIEVAASFAPQECNATNGVLASAGPFSAFRDFDNARFAKTWYPGALANRLAKTDLDTAGGEPLPELGVTSNGDLGKPGCLEGLSWYYGLDDKAPNEDSIDYVKTILHEYGHGLGFLSFANEATGELFDGLPSIWEHYMVDGKTGKLWVNMNDAERKASALNNQFLAWTGFQSFIGAQQTLTNVDTIDVFFFDRSGIALLPGGTANFGAKEGRRGISGLLGFLEDTRAPGAACAAFTSTQAASVRGKVAVVNRGGCAFTDKAKNAQAAGATAVIFINNSPFFPGRPAFGVDDPAAGITIASTLISQQDGVRLREGTRFASIFETKRPGGMDLFRRPLLYAPTEVRPGSSVSHWDVTATPNLLMEPNANGDESTALRAPKDLTLPLLKDIGW